MQINSYFSKLLANKTFKIWAVLLAIVALFFLLCFRVVGVGEVGIVSRFGRVTREQGSGVLIKLPYPIEHLVKMNVQIQKEQQDSSAATKDLQTVTTTLALNYNLTPATSRQVYQEVGILYKERIIDPILQESVKAVVSKYNADELIASRQIVAVQLEKNLVAKLSDRGITVDNVSIVNFNFSDAFNDAIEQKQVAQQNAQKAQYELQTAQLRAQSQDVQAKTLTPEYLQLQAIEKWDGKMPQAVSGEGNIFGINLKTTL